MSVMIERLEGMVNRYHEINEMMMSPEIETDIAEERSDFFPDVPTAKELGFDVVNNQDRGFVVHKSVPMETVKQLEAIFKQISEDEAFQKQAKELNMEVKFLGTDDYAEALKAEDAMYKEIIQKNGLGDKY